MAYSRVWSDTSPSGSALANTIDDEVRNLRVDVRERFDTLIGAGAWATDPIVDWTVVKTLYVPVWAGIKGFDSGNVGLADDVYGISLTNVGNCTWLIPIVLPQGCTIKGIVVPYVVGANQTIDLRLTNVGGSNLGSVSTGPSTSGNLSLGVLTQTTNALHLGVYIKLTATAYASVPRANGVIVTYTKPNMLASI